MGLPPGGGGNSVFRFRITPKDGKTEDIESRFEGSFSIPGTNLTGKIEDFSPALVLTSLPAGRLPAQSR